MNEHILSRPRNLTAKHWYGGAEYTSKVKAIVLFGMKGEERLYFDLELVLEKQTIKLRTNDWHVLRAENVELYKRADKLIKKFKEK